MTIICDTNVLIFDAFAPRWLSYPAGRLIVTTALQQRSVRLNSDKRLHAIDGLETVW